VKCHLKVMTDVELELRIFKDIADLRSSITETSIIQWCVNWRFGYCECRNELNNTEWMDWLTVGVAVGRKQDSVAQLVQDEDLCHLRRQSNVVWRHTQPEKLPVKAASNYSLFVCCLHAYIYYRDDVFLKISVGIVGHKLLPLRT